jgi:DNA polymerase
MYHPAAALHQASLRSTIEADFERLPRILAQAREQLASDEKPPDPAAQMRLF